MQFQSKQIRNLTLFLVNYQKTQRFQKERVKMTRWRNKIS